MLVLFPASAAEPAQDKNSQEMQHVVKKLPFGIVHEAWRDGNWDLIRTRADGSKPVNLTRTPGADELYPHVSPDGTKVLFTCDTGPAKDKRRSVYYMNLDGTGRTLVARHARQGCWSPDGKTVAYLKSLTEKLNYMDYATRGIFFYDLKTKATRQHPNKKIEHLYNLCWSPCGKWFVSTVHAGMGFKHAILAIQVDGMGVYNLGFHGCRPDLSPDGKRITWGESDWRLCIADIDLTGPEPKVSHKRAVVTSRKPIKVYHSDFSPDGKYVAFSTGPLKKRLGPVCEIVGMQAEGWNIGVADASATDRKVLITHDGKSNKEPDWIPLPRTKP